MPSIATKPNGMRKVSSPSATPTMPNGAVISTIAASEALQLQHQQCQPDKDHQRHAGTDRGLRLVFSSNAPPASMR